MPGKLISLTKDGQTQQEFPVVSLHVFIGSDSYCDLRIKHKEISAQHCLITAQKDKPALIRNLSRTSPTLVNGVEIGSKDVELKDQDVISIRHRQFKWCYDEVPESSVTSFMSSSNKGRKSWPLFKNKLVAVVPPQRRDEDREPTSKKRRATLGGENLASSSRKSTRKVLAIKTGVKGARKSSLSKKSATKVTPTNVQSTPGSLFRVGVQGRKSVKFIDSAFGRRLGKRGKESFGPPTPYRPSNTPGGRAKESLYFTPPSTLGSSRKPMKSILKTPGSTSVRTQTQTPVIPSLPDLSTTPPGLSDPTLPASNQPETDESRLRLHTPPREETEPPEVVMRSSKRSASRVVISSPESTPKSAKKAGKRLREDESLLASERAAKKLKEDPPRAIDKKKMAALLQCHRKSLTPHPEVKVRRRIFLAPTDEGRQSRSQKKSLPGMSRKSEPAKSSPVPARALRFGSLSNSNPRPSIAKRKKTPFKAINIERKWSLPKSSVAKMTSTPSPPARKMTRASRAARALRETRERGEVNDVLSALDLSRKFPSSTESTSVVKVTSPIADFTNVSGIKRLFSTDKTLDVRELFLEDSHDVSPSKSVDSSRKGNIEPSTRLSRRSSLLKNNKSTDSIEVDKSINSFYIEGVGELPASPTSALSVPVSPHNLSSMSRRSLTLKGPRRSSLNSKEVSPDKQLLSPMSNFLKNSEVSLEGQKLNINFSLQENSQNRTVGSIGSAFTPVKKRGTSLKSVGFSPELTVRSDIATESSSRKRGRPPKEASPAHLEKELVRSSSALSDHDQLSEFSLALSNESQQIDGTNGLSMLPDYSERTFNNSTAEMLSKSPRSFTSNLSKLSAKKQSRTSLRRIVMKASARKGLSKSLHQFKSPYVRGKKANLSLSEIDYTSPERKSPKSAESSKLASTSLKKKSRSEQSLVGADKTAMGNEFSSVSSNSLFVNVSSTPQSIAEGSFGTSPLVHLHSKSLTSLPSHSTPSKNISTLNFASTGKFTRKNPKSMLGKRSPFPTKNTRHNSCVDINLFDLGNNLLHRLPSSTPLKSNIDKSLTENDSTKASVLLEEELSSARKSCSAIGEAGKSVADATASSKGRRSKSLSHVTRKSEEKNLSLSPQGRQLSAKKSQSMIAINLSSPVNVKPTRSTSSVNIDLFKLDERLPTSPLAKRKSLKEATPHKSKASLNLSSSNKQDPKVVSGSTSKAEEYKKTRSKSSVSIDLFKLDENSSGFESLTPSSKGRKSRKKLYEESMTSAASSAAPTENIEGSLHVDTYIAGSTPKSLKHEISGILKTKDSKKRERVFKGKRSKSLPSVNKSVTFSEEIRTGVTQKSSSEKVLSQTVPNEAVNLEPISNSSSPNHPSLTPRKRGRPRKKILTEDSLLGIVPLDSLFASPKVRVQLGSSITSQEQTKIKGKQSSITPRTQTVLSTRTHRSMFETSSNSSLPVATKSTRSKSSVNINLFDLDAHKSVLKSSSNKSARSTTQEKSLSATKRYSEARNISANEESTEQNMNISNKKGRSSSLSEIINSQTNISAKKRKSNEKKSVLETTGSTSSGDLDLFLLEDSSLPHNLPTSTPAKHMVHETTNIVNSSDLSNISDGDFTADAPSILLPSGSAVKAGKTKKWQSLVETVPPKSTRSTASLDINLFELDKNPPSKSFVFSLKKLKSDSSVKVQNISRGKSSKALRKEKSLAEIESKSSLQMKSRSKSLSGSVGLKSESESSLIKSESSIPEALIKTVEKSTSSSGSLNIDVPKHIDESTVTKEDSTLKVKKDPGLESMRSRKSKNEWSVLDSTRPTRSSSTININLFDLENNLSPSPAKAKSGRKSNISLQKSYHQSPERTNINMSRKSATPGSSLKVETNEKNVTPRLKVTSSSQSINNEVKHGSSSLSTEKASSYPQSRSSSSESKSRKSKKEQSILENRPTRSSSTLDIDLFNLSDQSYQNTSLSSSKGDGSAFDLEQSFSSPQNSVKKEKQSFSSPPSVECGLKEKPNRKELSLMYNYSPQKKPTRSTHSLDINLFNLDKKELIHKHVTSSAKGSSLARGRSLSSEPRKSRKSQKDKSILETSKSARSSSAVNISVSDNKQSISKVSPSPSKDEKGWIDKRKQSVGRLSSAKVKEQSFVNHDKSSGEENTHSIEFQVQTTPGSNLVAIPKKKLSSLNKTSPIAKPTRSSHSVDINLFNLDNSKIKKESPASMIRDSLQLKDSFSSISKKNRKEQSLLETTINSMNLKENLLSPRAINESVELAEKPRISTSGAALKTSIKKKKMSSFQDTTPITKPTRSSHSVGIILFDLDNSKLSTPAEKGSPLAHSRSRSLETKKSRMSRKEQSLLEKTRSHENLKGSLLSPGVRENENLALAENQPRISTPGSALEKSIKMKKMSSFRDTTPKTKPTRSSQSVDINLFDLDNSKLSIVEGSTATEKGSSLTNSRSHNLETKKSCKSKEEQTLLETTRSHENLKESLLSPGVDKENENVALAENHHRITTPGSALKTSFKKSKMSSFQNTTPKTKPTRSSHSVDINLFNLDNSKLFTPAEKGSPLGNSRSRSLESKKSRKSVKEQSLLETTRSHENLMESLPGPGFVRENENLAFAENHPRISTPGSALKTSAKKKKISTFQDTTPITKPTRSSHSVDINLFNLDNSKLSTPAGNGSPLTHSRSRSLETKKSRMSRKEQSLLETSRASKKFRDSEASCSDVSEKEETTSVENSYQFSTPASTPKTNPNSFSIDMSLLYGIDEPLSDLHLPKEKGCPFTHRHSFSCGSSKSDKSTRRNSKKRDHSLASLNLLMQSDVELGLRAVYGLGSVERPHLYDSSNNSFMTSSVELKSRRSKMEDKSISETARPTRSSSSVNINLFSLDDKQSHSPNTTAGGRLTLKKRSIDSPCSNTKKVKQSLGIPIGSNGEEDIALMNNPSTPGSTLKGKPNSKKLSLVENTTPRIKPTRSSYSVDINLFGLDDKRLVQTNSPFLKTDGRLNMKNTKRTQTPLSADYDNNKQSQTSAVKSRTSRSHEELQPPTVGDWTNAKTPLSDHEGQTKALLSPRSRRSLRQKEMDESERTPETNTSDKTTPLSALSPKGRRSLLKDKNAIQTQTPFTQGGVRELSQALVISETKSSQTPVTQISAITLEPESTNETFYHSRGSHVSSPNKSTKIVASKIIKKHSAKKTTPKEPLRRGRSRTVSEKTVPIKNSSQKSLPHDKRNKMAQTDPSPLRTNGNVIEKVIAIDLQDDDLPKHKGRGSGEKEIVNSLPIQDSTIGTSSPKVKRGRKAKVTSDVSSVTEHETKVNKNKQSSSIKNNKRKDQEAEISLKLPPKTRGTRAKPSETPNGLTESQPQALSPSKKTDGAETTQDRSPIVKRGRGRPAASGKKLPPSGNKVISSPIVLARVKEMKAAGEIVSSPARRKTRSDKLDTEATAPKNNRRRGKVPVVTEPEAVAQQSTAHQNNAKKETSEFKSNVVNAASPLIKRKTRSAKSPYMDVDMTLLSKRSKTRKPAETKSIIKDNTPKNDKRTVKSQAFPIIQKSPVLKRKEAKLVAISVTERRGKRKTVEVVTKVKKMSVPSSHLKSSSKIKKSGASPISRKGRQVKFEPSPDRIKGVQAESETSPVKKRGARAAAENSPDRRKGAKPKLESSPLKRRGAQANSKNTLIKRRGAKSEASPVKAENSPVKRKGPDAKSIKSSITEKEKPEESPKAKRGRPAKSNLEVSSPVAKRGRPAKSVASPIKRKGAEAKSLITEKEKPEESPEVKRGRPAKSKLQVSSPVAKRGRPAKSEASPVKRRGAQAKSEGSSLPKEGKQGKFEKSPELKKGRPAKSKVEVLSPVSKRGRPAKSEASPVKRRGAQTKSEGSIFTKESKQGKPEKSPELKRGRPAKPKLEVSSPAATRGRPAKSKAISGEGLTISVSPPVPKRKGQRNSEGPSVPKRGRPLKLEPSSPIGAIKPLLANRKGKEVAQSPAVKRGRLAKLAAPSPHTKKGKQNIIKENKTKPKKKSPEIKKNANLKTVMKASKTKITASVKQLTKLSASTLRGAVKENTQFKLLESTKVPRTRKKN